MRRKFNIKKLLDFLEKRPWIVLIAFAIIIFSLFNNLFNSYFEADEWFHFTYYFPLTRKPDGFLTAIISTIISSGPLSAGQHVIPIASAIYFLNTKFFSMNYVPYAFMSLFLHAVNSFLVFVFIKTLLHRKDIITKNIFAILGAIFFAFAPTPMHAVTGAAPFYGQNILSVTFFLLTVLTFKIAFIHKRKKYIYFSILFLFLALFSKETSVFLFLLLPFMAVLEKRIFPMKFLSKLFLTAIIVYFIFRFLVPNFFSSTPESTPTDIVDTETIVSRDLSFYKNIPGEVMLRTVTFPFRMTGTLFLPRQTAFSIVEFITPVVVPLPDTSARLGFLHGAGNFSVIYLVALGILIFCIKLIIESVRKGAMEDARALMTGLAIIVFSTLPLVAIMFSFPRWGYDFYFDSRLYYNPSVGAAIVFPFLLLGIASFVYKALPKKPSLTIIALVLFGAWLVNNVYVLNLVLKQFIHRYSQDRREVVVQIKNLLPRLPEKIVFYTETDGLSAYGPNLPFNTSVPQALTIVYYDRSPLPDSFFEKPILEGKPEGYLFSEGRGFGYYASKKTLSEALLANDFKVSDIYAFYYKAQDVRVLDITDSVRAEMEDYLNDARANSDWKNFSDPSVFSLLYPPQAIIIQSPNLIRFESPGFTADLVFVGISPSFDINEYVRTRQVGSSDEILSKKVSFDKFHYNDSVVIIGQSKREYFVKLNDKLIKLETYNIDNESLLIIEKILGSIELIEKK